MSTDREFRRAIDGYDDAFRQRLTEALLETLVTTSTFTSTDGRKICALRTGESIDATADLLITLMTLVPQHDRPSTLRKNCEAIAKRVRKAVAQARAEGVADILGGARGGHA
jgi:hypothetical protein